MAMAIFWKALLIVSPAPLDGVDDELAAALALALALPLGLLPWLSLLMAITVPPCTVDGAVLPLEPCAADL